MNSIVCCEEAGDLTGREPEEAKTLEALKNVMNPDDPVAKELYEWLEREIKTWKEMAKNGADDNELYDYAEVYMFNIVDEINNLYLRPMPIYQAMRGSC